VGTDLAGGILLESEREVKGFVVATIRSSLKFRSLCEFARCRKIVLRMVLRDSDLNFSLNHQRFKIRVGQDLPELVNITPD